MRRSRVFAGIGGSSHGVQSVRHPISPGRATGIARYLTDRSRYR
jgi:hypothetical protein